MRYGSFSTEQRGKQSEKEKIEAAERVVEAKKVANTYSESRTEEIVQRSPPPLPRQKTSTHY